MGWVIYWVLSKPAQAKPEPACKHENAECNTNNSNKLCCEDENLFCEIKDQNKLDKAILELNKELARRGISKDSKYAIDRLAEVYEEFGIGKCKPEPTKPPIPTKPPKPTETPEVTPTLEPTPTPEPTVTPEVTPEPQKSESKPEGCAHDCPLPACTDQTPNPVSNPHIYRNNDCAIVKYWPSSDQVNLYWKEVSASDWQHALANQPATGSHEICELSGDVTFGVQSVSGCAADGIVNASTISEVVDGNTSKWILFK